MDDLLKNPSLTSQLEFNKNFNGKEWKKWFDYHILGLKKQKNFEGKNNLSSMRVLIQNQTIQCIKNKKYTKDNKDIGIDSENLLESIKFTQYWSEKNTKSVYEKKFEKTKVYVIEGDCLEIALKFKHEYNVVPIVLNMANQFNPGGGNNFFFD